MCAKKGDKVYVISDDTDVFVLLLYYYRKANLEVVVAMESPTKGRVIADTGLRSEKNYSIIEVHFQHMHFLVVTQWTTAS